MRGRNARADQGGGTHCESEGNRFAELGGLKGHLSLSESVVLYPWTHWRSQCKRQIQQVGRIVTAQAQKLKCC
ncbi:hypothetical protein LC55x_1229 [Lysobacter capsici]|uniref:Uncharacterized protein n=1 Tax=Lysobacter capsici AZ78 TaxID=1444315 RepID=A0A120AGA7_9GAMM|nr:hypothetical protein LC55x_1229 [Lysobacter capsici]KWS04297.1 hypothetical protein AZ78_1846 [Lysobacter capsici AZ78]